MCYGGKYMVEGGVGFESAASVVWKFLPLGPVALGLFGRGGIDLLTDTSSGETGRHAFIGAGLAAERR
jgi:hypothetical protein